MAAPPCPICGTPMVTFQNPKKYECPRPDKHTNMDRVANRRGDGGKGKKRGKK
jgi:hypothetical protein